MASVPLPKIAVHPSLTTTVDQKVDITVSKLSPEQHITLRARTIDDSKVVFESFAHYKADKNGEVLVSSQPSMGGSYAGVEPMGLFWSMKPVARPDRDDLFRKRDVTTPLEVTLDVYGKHEREFEQRDKMVSVTLLRRYMGPGVTRCYIEENRFYGTLFLPPGDGPFPGVIDMWGRTGGIREDRVALLASNGFASLTIAYSQFKDLPDKCDILDLSYFERAINWLIAHPKVASGGVALVGLSMGGVLALAIASQIPNKIKAVVSISGPHLLIGCSLKCHTLSIQGFPIDQTVTNNCSRYKRYVSTFKTIKEACKPESPWIIPVEHISCPVLLVYGHDDKLNPEIEWMFEDVFQHMEKHSKGSLCNRLGFPGTGHFITPCYLPPGLRHYSKVYDEVWYMGGNTKDQARASEIYWNKSLEFLLKGFFDTQGSGQNFSS